jgi:dTMP kinase
MGDPGRLIAFEGVEGAGKSTQLELLRQALEGRGREVVVTREPGGTPAGERVRAVVLDPGVELHPRAEALLFAAARAELVEEVIRPARSCCATATWTPRWPTRGAPAGSAWAR